LKGVVSYQSATNESKLEMNHNNNSIIVEIQTGYDDYDPFHIIYEKESSLIPDSERKIFLGEKENKICRFCL